MRGPSREPHRRRGRRWTFLVLGPGTTESRRFELGRLALLLLLSAAALAPLLIGAAAGRMWERAREAGRAAALEEELGRLEGERERLDQLASKLEAMEASYLRIRRAMGGEVARSERDVLLPTLAGAGEGPVHPATAGDGDPAWAWPLAQAGFVTRSFGSPVGSGAGGHPGLDIAVPLGSYVRSVAAGVVSEAGLDSVYGYYARIAHRDDVSSLYAHNSWVFVAAGDTVERLQVIALSGNTGRSTAPHLHLEIERNGAAVDPSRYIAIGR